IKKEKLFFFADYQGTRRRRAASVVTTVPTAAERAGNLTGLLGDYICSNGSASAGPCASPLAVPTSSDGLILNGSAPARAGLVFWPASGNPDGSGRMAIATGGQVNVLPAVPAAITNLLNFIPMPNTAPGEIANNF